MWERVNSSLFNGSPPLTATPYSRGKTALVEVVLSGYADLTARSEDDFPHIYGKGVELELALIDKNKSSAHDVWRIETSVTFGTRMTDSPPGCPERNDR